MKIYLIRHGRQCDKRCNVDVALSQEGVRQALLAGERLKNAGIQKVYASDMIRARQTAEYANRYWNVDIEIVPAFRELCFGEMEGMEVDEMNVRYADFKNRQDLMEQDIPYPKGESGTALAARSLPAFMKVVEDGEEDCIAIATHGCWIRMMICHLFGIPMARWKTLGVTFENGSITELGYDREKKRFSLERFNDYAHLEPYPELLRSAWGVIES